MKGQLRIGNQKVSSALGVKELVTQDNIDTYKLNDMQGIITGGGEESTDLEYEALEVQLQGLYSLIMEGSNE